MDSKLHSTCIALSKPYHPQWKGYCPHYGQNGITILYALHSVCLELFVHKLFSNKLKKNGFKLQYFSTLTHCFHSNSVFLHIFTYNEMENWRTVKTFSFSRRRRYFLIFNLFKCSLSSEVSENQTCFETLFFIFFLRGGNTCEQ